MLNPLFGRVKIPAFVLDSKPSFFSARVTYAVEVEILFELACRRPCQLGGRLVARAVLDCRSPCQLGGRLVAPKPPCQLEVSHVIAPKPRQVQPDRLRIARFCGRPPNIPARPGFSIPPRKTAGKVSGTETHM